MFTITSMVSGTGASLPVASPPANAKLMRNSSQRAQKNNVSRATSSACFGCSVPPRPPSAPRELGRRLRHDAAVDAEASPLFSCTPAARGPGIRAGGALCRFVERTVDVA